MRYALRTIFIATTIVAMSGRLEKIEAQSRTPACRLLSSADITAATGIKGYGPASNGDPDGQGAGGGSSCQYGGAGFIGRGSPMVSFVLISGQGYTKWKRGSRLVPGCKLETVAGVADDAFFESCPRQSRGAPLYVRVGAKDLIVQMDIDPPVTAATVRKNEIAIARAAVAKLRRAVP